MPPAAVVEIGAAATVGVAIGAAATVAVVISAAAVIGAAVAAFGAAVATAAVVNPAKNPQFQENQHDQQKRRARQCHR